MGGRGNCGSSCPRSCAGSRSPRRRRGGGRRRAGAGAAVRVGRRLPRRPPAGRGDDADRDPLDGGAGARQPPATRLEPALGRCSPPARTRSPARPSDARRAARGGRRRRRRRRAWSRSSAARSPACGARAALAAAVAGARRSRSTRSTSSPAPYRYCTTFSSRPGVAAIAIWRSPLTAIGDSLIVVGDPRATKVHVHTDDPGPRSRPASAGALAASRWPTHGALARAHAAPAQRAASAARPATALVAVTAGDERGGGLPPRRRREWCWWRAARVRGTRTRQRDRRRRRRGGGRRCVVLPR